MSGNIIILIGPICAGKGNVAQILEQDYGFHTIRFSQILEEEMVNRGLGVKRENYSKVGNLLRQEYGSNALAVKIMEKINNESLKNIVLDGARNPSEIEYIRNNAKDKQVLALVINAPQELRFQRLQSRKREGDPQTFEQFKTRDDIELFGDGTPHSQRIMDCILIADQTINNTGEFVELKQKLERMLKSRVNTI
jgi:dephospho-CoA kinase